MEPYLGNLISETSQIRGTLKSYKTMTIPSQASKDEGVETLREVPKSLW